MFEDPLEPFVPKQPPTEADHDRQEAAALAGAGHAHEERGEFRQALRMYQRALRLNPKLHDLAQMVVLLAHALGQDDVAVRYLKWTDPADDDPELLQDLADEMVERDDLAGAATLLERVLAAQKSAKENDAIIRLRMRTGRLCWLLEQYPKAADHFAHVMRAIENPRQFGLNEDTRKKLLGKASETFDLIGDCFLRAGRLQEATAAFQKADAESPNAGLLEFNLARVAAGRASPPRPSPGWKRPCRRTRTSRGPTPTNCWPRC